VAVAEELHFRRAAERLHVAQPAVSDQVRKLEVELGVRLLDRDQRSVRLTDAGAAMLEEARRVLRQAEVAQRVARQAQQRWGHRLRVGCLPDALPAALSRTLGRLAGAAPAIDLVLETGHGAELVEAVRADRLDLAAVCLPAGVAGLRTVSLGREGTVAAVPVLHRLADARSITLERLADSNLVVLPRTVNPAFYDGVIACCLEAGFSPALFESEQPRVEHALMSVALGRGIALLPASAAERYSLPGVCFRPLTGIAPSCEVALVTRPDPTAAVAQLLKLITNTTPLERPTTKLRLVPAA
jgi:DNA-binding transcriptional LysR family regulator